ncbi:hypothetical protein [Streptomyces sediminimaris]|uniref:hypothetical protein n=1 Tax=Streptomyces sediminimaris TaxID=3383721 RepID=UPI00399BE11B
MSTNPVTSVVTPAAPRPALDGLLAVLPAAVDAAMRKTLPHHYTPELARQTAADTAARLTHAHTGGAR